MFPRRFDVLSKFQEEKTVIALKDLKKPKDLQRQKWS